MGKGKKLAIGISGILIGGILLSGGMAFAESSGNSRVAKLAGKIPWVGQKMGHRGGIIGVKGQFGTLGVRLCLENLDQLVEEGTITQVKADEIRTKRQQKISDVLETLVGNGTISREQSDKILKSFADAAAYREAEAEKIENMTVREARQYIMDNRGKPQNNLGQLVTDGVIIQEQADAFKNAMALNAQALNQQRLTDGMKALVDKGTITQDQVNKILAKLESVRTDKEAYREKIKNMTPEERQEYIKTNRFKPQNPINQLTTEGTLTQEQAKALRGITGFGGKPGFGGKQSRGDKTGPIGRGGRR